MTDFTEQIQAGMAQMDREQPDWDKFVNLDILDMGRADNCIRGQVFGDFWESLNGPVPRDENEEFGTWSFRQAEWATARGFLDPDFWCAELTEQWREAIKGRRESHAQARTAAPAEV